MRGAAKRLRAQLALPTAITQPRYYLMKTSYRTLIIVVFVDLYVFKCFIRFDFYLKLQCLWHHLKFNFKIKVEIEERSLEQIWDLQTISTKVKLNEVNAGHLYCYRSCWVRTIARARIGSWILPRSKGGNYNGPVKKKTYLHTVGLGWIKSRTCGTEIEINIRSVFLL
jgi:hypothetical protein